MKYDTAKPHKTLTALSVALMSGLVTFGTQQYAHAAETVATPEINHVYNVKDATQGETGAYKTYTQQDSTYSYSYTNADGETVTKDYDSVSVTEKYQKTELKPDVPVEENQLWFGDFIDYNGDRNPDDITANHINGAGFSVMVDKPAGHIGNLTGDYYGGSNGGWITGVFNQGTIGDVVGDFVNNNSNTRAAAGITTQAVDVDGTRIIPEMGNVYSNFINNTGGGVISSQGAVIGDITGDFIANKSNSSLIYNSIDESTKVTAVMGNINGNFINNTAQQLIYNRTSEIGNINGSFVGNTTVNGGQLIFNLGNEYGGGEKKQAVIDSITGDFVKNNSSSNLIYNNYGQIGDIDGNFVDNKFSSNVIFNNNGSSIENIKGNFINNTSNNWGNIIYNHSSTIQDIDGSFIGNKSGSALIFNEDASIGNITGDFIENTAGGVLIHNSSSHLGNINGNFIKNKSSHIIYNPSNRGEGQGVGNITGDFIENTVSGSVIFNAGNIGDVTSNFVNNKVTSSLIFNPTGKIGVIHGDFIGNTNTGSSNYANVIDNTSNSSSIERIESNFVGNTNFKYVLNNYGSSFYGDNEKYLDIKGDFINNKVVGIIANGGSNSLGNLESNFAKNEVLNGRIIDNNGGKIKDITGDFVENKNTATSIASYHSLISNGGGKIGNLNSSFSDNENFYYTIYNAGGKIESLTGDFVHNTGGAGIIFNSGGTIDQEEPSIVDENEFGNIKGSFINNEITGQSIITNNGGTIKDINGSFVGNKTTLTNISSYENGGLIDNRGGHLGNITGDFKDNEGFMYLINNNGGTIGNIEGNVSGNKLREDTTLAHGYILNLGGHIENINFGNSVLSDVTSTTTSWFNSGLGLANYGGTIGDVTANFKNLKTETGKGGAITNANGTLNASIKSITGNFEQNSATLGGAIMNDGGKIGNLKGAYIENTATAGWGGAISNGGGVLGDITALFEKNSATKAADLGYEGGGGAIWNAGGQIGTVSNSEFRENTASWEGGAIYNGSGKITEIKDTNFVNNKSSIAGGAISTTNGANVGKISGAFVGNRVESETTATGGAIYMVRDSRIDDIEAGFGENYVKASGDAKGGAIYNIQGSYIANVTGNIVNNYAESTSGSAAGGAIYMDQIGDIGNIVGTVANNYVKASADAVGGAIYNDGKVLTLTNSSLIGNYAQSQSGEAKGGAIYSTKDVTLNADNTYVSVISGNYTQQGEKVEQNAIYMNSQGEELVKLNLDAKTGAKFVLNDAIDGNKYAMNLTGDNSGETYINNKIANADITQTSVTSYVNEASNLNFNNSLNIASGVMNINHLGLESLHLRSFTNDGTLNLNSVDINPVTETMGRITSDEYGSYQGTINVNRLNILAEPEKMVTDVLFADSSFANTVNYRGSNEYLGKIYKYSVNYLSDTGEFEFVRGGGASSGSAGYYNPAILASPVNSKAANKATLNETFRYVFEHADTFTQMPMNNRVAIIKANQYALSSDFNSNLGSINPDFNNKAGWFIPYATFESMNIKNGPKVNAITYGSLVGFDGDFKAMKNGWTRLGTGYLGYNGSQLSYKGVDTTMNGGILGMTETFYKGNFWTAMTVSAGASVGENKTAFGKEDFTSLLAGVASKTGYNFEFKEGRYIIQPIWFMSYTFANTFNYTAATGAKIDSDPMHSLQLNPTMRFIMNTKNGWQPYASVGMVWNVMNTGSTTADGVKLPDMSIKPYVEYGLGLQKTFKENYTAFGQAMVRNGGRNGVALTFGFRWALGKDSADKDEKVMNPSKNKLGKVFGKRVSNKV